MVTSNLIPFEQLKAGDHVRITQRIKVGLKIWKTEVSGTVKESGRRRNGLHVQRSPDDKAYQDFIILTKDGDFPEITTITMDEWTHVERI